MNLLSCLTSDRPQVFSHWKISRVRDLIARAGFALVFEQSKPIGVVSNHSIQEAKEGFICDYMDERIITFHGDQKVELTIQLMEKKRAKFGLVFLDDFYCGLVQLNLLKVAQSKEASRQKGPAAPPKGRPRQSELQALQVENEQLKAQAEKRDVELNLYQQILSLVPIPLLVVDKNWRIQNANEIWRDLAGVMPEDLIGQDATRLLYLKSDKSLLKEKGMKLRQGFLLIHKQAYPVQLQVYPVSGESEVILFERGGKGA